MSSSILPTKNGVEGFQGGFRVEGSGLGLRV